ncbi:MAG: RyR domain-containing protein [Halobacteriota archaeon]
MGNDDYNRSKAQGSYREAELEGEMLEALAKATHVGFCERLRKLGYMYDPQTNSKHKTSVALVPYAKLSERTKEQNRLYVRDIPEKLAAAGYVISPAFSNDRALSFPDEILEKLAEAEHERWIQFMKHDGWSYGPETDRSKKKHNCLLPWDELPEDEKEKDRDLVRDIPNLLALGGYTVVKSGA